MRPVRSLRRITHNIHHSTQTLSEIREGTAIQSEVFHHKLNELIDVCQHIATMQKAQVNLMAELTRILSLSAGQQLNTELIDQALNATKYEKVTRNVEFQGPPSGGASAESSSNFKDAMARIPLLLAEKTYNTAHPAYNAHTVRNYPGQIFNAKIPSSNAVYKSLRKLAKGDKIPDSAWEKVLKAALAEAREVPGAQQVFERKDYIERYLDDLKAKYQAHYVAGWVNLEDALFLYWMIRQLKPKTVVQTGVCNGLSSAFMMLALAKNGPEGTLHVIDLPAVFNPQDPDWTVKNKVYGVVIPEGKSSGWMVPDMYRDRFFVQNGDAKELLPPLIDSLDSIDMFYHDSDHTYNHMMFEFRQAKRKLNQGGLMVGDDISWNASVWDFADEYGVPSYNYKGAVGVAFF